MKRFTLIGVYNTDGQIYFRHWMATDANAAVAMAAEDADVSFFAALPGWHESLMRTDGQPRKAEDVLWTDDEEDIPPGTGSVASFVDEDGGCNVFVYGDGSVSVADGGRRSFPSVTSAISYGDLPADIITKLREWSTNNDVY